MNESEIRKYAALMAELGLTGLEIREDAQTVRLERAPAGAATAPAIPASAPIPTEEDDAFVVRSPLVGVFYQAAAENAEPYVKVGDSVHKGAVLCLVEAMKVMNEITAEIDGTVAEICVQNGQVVDYGCPLFRIKRQ